EDERPHRRRSALAGHRLGSALPDRAARADREEEALSPATNEVAGLRIASVRHCGAARATLRGVRRAGPAVPPGSAAPTACPSGCAAYEQLCLLLPAHPRRPAGPPECHRSPPRGGGYRRLLRMGRR